MMRLTLRRIWQAASGSFVVSSSRNFWRRTRSLQSLSARTVAVRSPGLAEERDLAEEVALLEEGDALGRALHLARALQDHEHLALADARARDEVAGLDVQEVAGLRQVEERARREGVHEGGDRSRRSRAAGPGAPPSTFSGSNSTGTVSLSKR